MTVCVTLLIIFVFRNFWFRNTRDLIIENEMLKRQIKILKRQVKRPKLTRWDRIYWVLVRLMWSNWKAVLYIVKPATVMEWHRQKFRLFWSRISRPWKRDAKAELRKEIRELIRKMATDNETWGAPRIHGELLKLGYKVSERTVSRHLSRLRPTGKSGINWMTFLNNHRKGIAAMDFFTVPTLFFRQLYGFFIIRHDTRKIIHFGVTYHPTAEWVIEQLRIAFPENGDGLKYMIMDRATSFSLKVRQTLKEFGIEAVRTSYRSPWQNGIAERWVGSCRRELLNHIIPFNEKHLYILLSEYVEYYNKDRTHYSRDKEPPEERSITKRQSPDDYVIALPRCGGLHHKYIWASAA